LTLLPAFVNTDSAYGNSWEQLPSSSITRCTASSAGARSRSAQESRTRESAAKPAQLDESASDEDVDVAGDIVKRTRIYDTVIKSFHVDPDCQPVDPAATRIDTIISAEQTNAPRELDLATPPTFTAPTTTNDVTRARYRPSMD
jgi:hypothetical protein